MGQCVSGNGFGDAGAFIRKLFPFTGFFGRLFVFVRREEILPAGSLQGLRLSPEPVHEVEVRPKGRKGIRGTAGEHGKETFNGFGNAIEYLGRYTHKIAISNSRILSFSETEVSFSARALRRGEPKRTITIGKCEFIRRFLLHVLPAGFQKVRYYGFLNNRSKSRNLKLIFTIQGHQRFRERFAGMSMAELVRAVWKTDITKCPVCGTAGMLPAGRTYASG